MTHEKTDLNFFGTIGIDFSITQKKEINSLDYMQDKCVEELPINTFFNDA